MDENKQRSFQDIASDMQPIELTAIKQIDWVALGEALARIVEPFRIAATQMGLRAQEWYDALPDELKQQITGDEYDPENTREKAKQRTKQDVENKRRMQRGGKYKAF